MSETLRVVCWKWHQPGYRSKFTAEHVNVLANMVRRNYWKPVEVVCITDDTAGIDSSITTIPLWDTYASLPNHSFRHGPSCYRRLKAFSREAEQIIGPRFVSLDLDVVITGDVTPLWDRPDDFVIWGDTLPGYWYNGSMWLLRAGARPQVWEDFDPVLSPRSAVQAGRKGSDQAWISHKLGPGEKTWTIKDGVYSFRNHLGGDQLRDRRAKVKPLPDDARIVIFHGHWDPWSPEAQRVDWVRRNWR